jgi:hypothetical protein
MFDEGPTATGALSHIMNLEKDMTKPQDEDKKQPPKKPEDKLHRAEEALGDAPAGGPNATERSRLAD